MTALVAISTSTSSSAVAVGRDDGACATATLQLPHSHAEFVAAAIRQCAAAAGVSVDELDAVAVDVGPGMFTGVRVGIATAKGMAIALGVPMVTLSSLDLIAHALRWHVGEIAVALDARRSEVFAGRYRSDGAHVVAIDAPRAVVPTAFAAELATATSPVLCAGTGVQVYPSIFDDAGLRHAGGAFAHPSASAAFECAGVRIGAGAGVSPRDVAPIYLRRSDAEIVADGRSAATS